MYTAKDMCYIHVDETNEQVSNFFYAEATTFIQNWLNTIYNLICDQVLTAPVLQEWISLGQQTEQPS